VAWEVLKVLDCIVIMNNSRRVGADRNALFSRCYEFSGEATPFSPWAIHRRRLQDHDHCFSFTPESLRLLRLEPCGVIGEAAGQRPFRFIAKIAVLPYRRTALEGELGDAPYHFVLDRNENVAATRQQSFSGINRPP
jgi:hypothetical protein